MNMQSGLKFYLELAMENKLISWGKLKFSKTM